jgi:hypothetical protein
MKCDNYRDALLDAATGNMKDRIRAHVEECSQCRATLREERALFAAIDQTLRACTAELPRDGFLADVRARISQEPEPSSARNPFWILATASVMVTMLAMIAPWTRLRHEPTAASEATLSKTHTSVNAEVAEPRRTKRGTVVTSHADIRPPNRRRNPAQIIAREPEVLVPPDEAEAFAQFVARVVGRDARAEAVVRPMRDQAPDNKQLLEFQLVDIADLQEEPKVWEEK